MLTVEKKPEVIKNIDQVMNDTLKLYKKLQKNRNSIYDNYDKIVTADGLKDTLLKYGVRGKFIDILDYMYGNGLE